MSQTNNLKITLLEQSQAQKEITVNQAISAIDAIENKGIVDKDLSAPPGSPASGDLYIVGASATGAWTGKDKSIAWFDQAWKFITPNEGMAIWVNDEDRLYIYDGSNWILSISSLNSVGGVNITGTPADNSFFTYDSASAKWINEAPSAARTSMGLGSIATQNSSSVAISGGAIDGAAIGATTPSTGAFTSLTVTGTISGGNVGINAQTGTSYTVTSSDNGKVITLSSSSATTVTLPQTSTESLPQGFNVALVQVGTGEVTIAKQGSDNLYSEGTKLKLNAQYSQATIVKTVAGSPNTWVMSGSLKV